MHICISKLTIISSNNGLSLGRPRSHYLNQCWNIVKFQWNLKWNSNIFIQENAIQNVVCKMWAILSRPQCVNILTMASISKLTHWGRDKMDAISQTTFSSAFSWMKMFEFRLKFHWSLFLRVQLTIFQHWFRQWLGAVQATSHYLNQWWLIYRRIYASLSLNELTDMDRLCHHRMTLIVIGA